MKRRLAAILAADMVGYSRLIEQDEAGTLARLNSLRSTLIDPKIARHNGRIVKLMGDGMLVEFGSVVDAVTCAVNVQREIAAHSSDLPEDRRISFRIGINLGDIIVQNDDILGDGVNVAARLEQQADPGGICLSGTAYDHLKTQIDIGYEPLGEITAKNIATPIRAYRVLLDGSPEPPAAPRPDKRRAPVVLATLGLLAVLLLGGWWWSTRPDFEPITPAGLAMEIPDGPSIAVLPFEYLGVDEAANGFLADGLTENITAHLAKIPEVLVIARSSTSDFKGKTVDLQEISQRFGVRYVLQGSVQKAGDNLRITAQLIDAVAGKHKWAETYDRPATDLFSIQDDITLRVLRDGFGQTLEGDQSARHGTENLSAFSEYLQGRRDRQEFTSDAIRAARTHFQKAVEIDPKYTDAYAELSSLVIFSARFQTGKEKQKLLAKAEQLAKKALEIDPNHAPSLSRMAYVRVLQKRGDDARDFVTRSLDLAPNDFSLVHTAGIVANYIGDSKASITHFQKVNRLHPVPKFWLMVEEILAYSAAGQSKTAIQLNHELLALAPSRFQPGFTRTMAILYWLDSDMTEARIWADKYREMKPGYSVADLRKSYYTQDAYLDRMIPDLHLQALRELGFPEKRTSSD